MRLGCCTWNFMTAFPSPPEPAIQTVAELGFEGFELIAFSRQELEARYAAEDVRALRRWYQSLGLTLTEFVLDSGALQGLAGYDLAAKQHALATFELAASVARDLGSPLINFVPNWAAGLQAPHVYLPLYIHPALSGARSGAGPTWRLEMPADFNWQHAWENYCDSMAACSEIAHSRGLQIALEAHPLVMFSTSDSLLRLFERLPTRTLGVNLDMAMCALHREYPPLAVHRLADRVLHVHARDADGLLNYGLPAGMGILDWPEIVRSLRAVGYRGFLSIEFGENTRQPREHARRARDYLESVLASS